MEGALGERLKREFCVAFDEDVAMAGLVYRQRSRSALKKLWNGYLDIAKESGLPFIATTPTRRANKERIERSGFTERIIKDNVSFLKSVLAAKSIESYAGGLMGCRGDAYTGEGCLNESDAYGFHSYAVELFKDAGADFIFAGIMPTLPEAKGLARAAGDTGLPYIISFTVKRDGRLIEGTAVSEAIEAIDYCVKNKPVCYMANCVHPEVLHEALSQPFNRNETVKRRFLGIQANTSPLTYEELDNAPDLKCSEPESFGEETVKLLDLADFKIFGGCCGTDDRHMRSIARNLGVLKQNS